MSDHADDLELVYDLGTQAVSFDLHEELYAKEAVYGAAYLFVDRAYVFLTRPGDHLIRVRLRSRDAVSEEQLVALAGEFANELLNQMVRRQVSESTRQIREYTLARARSATVRHAPDGRGLSGWAAWARRHGYRYGEGSLSRPHRRQQIWRDAGGSGVTPWRLDGAAKRHAIELASSTR